MPFINNPMKNGADRSANAEPAKNLANLKLGQLASSLFPDNAAAQSWFAEQRWQGEAFCPHCASMDIQKGAQHKTMPYRCRSCRKRFSVRTGTAMEHSNLDYRTWALAMHSFAALGSGLSSMKLHRDLGISYKSAWHLIQRLREIRQDQQNPLFDCIHGLTRLASASQEGNGHLLPRAGLGHRTTGETKAIRNIGWNIFPEDAPTVPADSKGPSWMICHEESLPPNDETRMNDQGRRPFGPIDS